MIRIKLWPPRVWIRGHRIHHGLIGLLLCLHDIHDWRVWITDFIQSYEVPVLKPSDHPTIKIGIEEDHDGSIPPNASAT